MLKLLVRITAFSALAILFSSCEKETNSPVNCLNDAATLRIITNQQATIKAFGGNFYIVKQGAIDTRLIPCNLTKEFQKDNLPVIISGDVKALVQPLSGICCTENLVIVKITR